MPKTSSKTIHQIREVLIAEGKALSRSTLTNKINEKFGTALSTVYRCLNKGEKFLISFEINTQVIGGIPYYFIGELQRPEITAATPGTGILGLGTQKDVEVLTALRKLMDETCATKGFTRQEYDKKILGGYDGWPDFTSEQSQEALMRGLLNDGTVPLSIVKSSLLKLIFTKG